MLEVHHFDIDIGQNKVMLNQLDARRLGLNAGDRVRVRAKGAAITALLDTTKEMVNVGQLGLFTEAYAELRSPKEADVMPAPRPASLYYIKNIMDGKKLSEEQIRNIVQDIVDNNLSDMELSAYVTASYIHNLDAEQTEWLTKAMIATGDRIHFDTHPVMDKHSIGGVPGNKVSLLVVPIVAAAGLLIPKTSSRAITGAGGTAEPHGDTGTEMSLHEATVRITGDTAVVTGRLVVAGRGDDGPFGEIKESTDTLLRVNGVWQALASSEISLAPGAQSAVTPLWRDGGDWLQRHAGFVADAKKGGVDVLFLGDSITDLWRSRGRAVWTSTSAASMPPTLGSAATAPSTCSGGWITVKSPVCGPRRSC